MPCHSLHPYVEIETEGVTPQVESPSAPGLLRVHSARADRPSQSRAEGEAHLVVCVRELTDRRLHDVAICGYIRWSQPSRWAEDPHRDPTHRSVSGGVPSPDHPPSRRPPVHDVKRVRDRVCVGSAGKSSPRRRRTRCPGMRHRSSRDRIRAPDPGRALHVSSRR